MMQIAKEDQSTKQCTRCSRSITLQKSTTVTHEHIETQDGIKQRGITKFTSTKRVKVLATFPTLDEAGDYVRFLKLPPELRDPAKTELYQSSLWRD